MRSRLIRPLISLQLALLFGLAWSPLAQADIAVIVHPDNPVSSLNPKQVSDFYMGRNRHFHTDVEQYALTATVLEHPSNSLLRESFFQSLNGMSLNQLNAYWARLRFSGEVLPPAAMPDSRAVLEAVRRNRNAIGYVDAATVDGSVKIILRISRRD